MLGCHFFSLLLVAKRQTLAVSKNLYKMNSDVLVVLEFPWMIPYVDLETIFATLELLAMKKLSQTKICSDRMQSTPQRREQSWRNTCSLSSKMSTRCWAVFVHCRRNLVQWWLNICYFRAFGDEKALYQPRSVLRTSCFQLSSSQTLVTRGCCLSLAGLCWAVISFRSCWLPRDRRSQYKMNSDVLVVLEFPRMIPYVDLETWLDDWPTAYVCFGSSFWIGVCARQLWMKKHMFGLTERVPATVMTLNICYFRAFGDEKALYQPRSVLRTSCFQLSSSQTLVTRGCCLSLAGLCWAVISFRSCWLPRDRRSQYKMNSDVLVVLEFPWMIPYVDLETWLDDWPTAYVCFGSSF